MLRILYLLSFFLAVPLCGGVTYKFEVKSTGPRESEISGRLEADGGHIRMDIEHGDPILFKDKSVVLSSDGGKTMTVIDPATKTYFIIDLATFLGGSMNALKDFGADIKFENPKIDVHDAGPAPAILGYPTRKTTIDAAYDMVIAAAGSTMRSHMSTHTDVWRTEKLPAIVTPFQVKGIRTGIPAFDKMIEAYDKDEKGFVMREETTVETTQGANKLKVTQATNISDMHVRDVAASEFVMPSGYTKTENPIEKLLGSIRK